MALVQLHLYSMSKGKKNESHFLESADCLCKGRLNKN